MGDDGPARLADGYLEFPRHLWVEGTALGASFRARIGGSDLTLVVPVAHGGGGAMHLGPPPPVPGVTSPKAWSDSSTWGSSSGDGTARVEMVRVALEVVLGEPLPPHVIEPGDVRKWVELFLEWTTAWTNDPAVQSTAVDGHLRIIDIGGVTAHGHGGTVFIGASIRGRPSAALSLAQLNAAAAKASMAERLPLEHRLLLDALDSDDFRRAVIDAATAVEVALSSSITGWLIDRGTRIDVVEALVLSTNGLTGLGKLHQKLIGTFRPEAVSGRDFERFCQLRNDAAHRGIVRTDRVDLPALETAVRLVDHLRPLPR